MIVRCIAVYGAEANRGGTLDYQIKTTIVKRLRVQPEIYKRTDKLLNPALPKLCCAVQSLLGRRSLGARRRAALPYFFFFCTTAQQWVYYTVDIAVLLHSIVHVL